MWCVARPSCRQEGNVTVELALAMPLLLLLVAGTIDLGMLFWEKHVITNAAREGARAAAKAKDTGTALTAQYTQTQIKSVVQNYLNSYAIKALDGSPLVLTNSTFQYTWENTGSGMRLKVQLQQIPYRLWLLHQAVAFFGASGGSDAFYLGAETTMAAEWSTPPGP
jgi:Flp pilus assembly protein TadG